MVLAGESGMEAKGEIKEANVTLDGTGSRYVEFGFCSAFDDSRGGV